MLKRYLNRKDAALKLIPYLDKYKNDNCIVLAVPNGGVPLACAIAKNFHFPLDLLMIKKIGHPHNSEFAIGAVSLEDHVVDERINISKAYIDQSVYKIRKSLEEKYKRFMQEEPAHTLTDKVLIIVDDGMATGNTIFSSIQMLKRKKPKKIIIAVPVSPSETVHRLKKFVDDFICPFMPDNFYGVGFHYSDFSSVSDEEVIKQIRELKHEEVVV